MARDSRFFRTAAGGKHLLIPIEEKGGKRPPNRRYVASASVSRRVPQPVKFCGTGVETRGRSGMMQRPGFARYLRRMACLAVGKVVIGRGERGCRGVSLSCSLSSLFSQLTAGLGSRLKVSQESFSSHLIPPDIGEGCGVETSIPLPNRPLHSVVFTEFQGPQF